MKCKPKKEQRLELKMQSDLGSSIASSCSTLGRQDHWKVGGGGRVLFYLPGFLHFGCNSICLHCCSWRSGSARGTSMHHLATETGQFSVMYRREEELNWIVPLPRIFDTGGTAVCPLEYLGMKGSKKSTRSPSPGTSVMQQAYPSTAAALPKPIHYRLQSCLACNWTAWGCTCCSKVKMGQFWHPLEVSVTLTLPYSSYRTGFRCPLVR